ncbi:MAG TPA: ATP-dependent Clp protease proteolytic subunit [Actinomycetes bacterium]
MSWREVDQLGAAAGWPPEVPPWQPTPEPWPFPQPPGTLPPVEPPRPALPEWWEPPARAADLEAQLLDRRILLLSGYLDSAVANRGAAAVMLLDARSAEPVEIRISCYDGELEAASTLAETIDLARSPVRAVGSGTIGGPAVLAYVVAERRAAHLNSTFQLREPRMRAEGSATEIAVQLERQQQLLVRCVARIAEATGQTTQTVETDLRAGRMLSAEEAVAYGLVHELLSRATDKS